MSNTQERGSEYFSQKKQESLKLQAEKGIKPRPYKLDEPLRDLMQDFLNFQANNSEGRCSYSSALQFTLQEMARTVVENKQPSPELVEALTKYLERDDHQQL